MRIDVLIRGALHPQAVAAFKANEKFNIQYLPDCSLEELLQALPTAQVLVTRSETKVDRKVLDAAPHLKIVAVAAVGVANVDIDYATEKGILVVNCPGKNTNSAAELSFALLLAMIRNVPQAQQHMKSGGWDRHRFKGYELKEKSMGIVGVGNVGHRMAKFARGFDMQVFAYDPYLAPAKFQQYQCTPVQTLKELAEKSDVLTVHVPLNKETRGMVDKSILASMKDGSYIINAARGGIVDENEMLACLNSGKLAGVGIDTWENEPEPMRGLVEHAKVWCTPHIGAATEEATASIGKTVYEQVVKATSNQVVDYPVNLPEVGVIDHAVLQAYAVLAEKLGSVSGQILDFNPSEIEISYRGELASLNHSLLKLGFLKGFADKIVDGYVSFVNAPAQIEKLGISVHQTTDTGFKGYNSAIKIYIRGKDGKTFTIGGTVFDEKIQRLSLINEYYFEVEPSGCFLIVENQDKPGVVGDLGTYLGKSGINIDSFDLSRNKTGGNAMALIRVDSEPSAKNLEELNKIKNVISVKSVSL